MTRPANDDSNQREASEAPLIDIARLADPEGVARGQDDTGRQAQWHQVSSDGPLLVAMAAPALGAGLMFSVLADAGFGVGLGGVFAWVGLGAWGLYLFAWVASRIGGQRRIGLLEDSLFLPAKGLRLVGITVPYHELEEVSTLGPADRFLSIRFRRGTRRFRPRNASALKDAISERAPQLGREISR